MTPFLQFRIWFRRASVGQRSLTAVGVTILAALVVWSAVPSSGPGSALVAAGSSGGGASSGTSGTGGRGGAVSGAATVGSLPGATGSSVGASPSAGTGDASGGVGSPAATGLSGDGGGGAPAPATATPAGGSSSPTTGTGQAAAQSCSTRGKLKIGVVVPVGAGGTLNSVIGNPPASQEEADYAAALDSINQAGGVACNDLVGDYVTSDLANPSGAQAGCLKFAQDKVFAVVGGFLPTFTDDCLLQAHIPTIDELAVPTADVKRFSPYYFSTYPTYEVLYKNFVDAINQMGYFGPAKHFAKFGVFYKDCLPAVNQALLADLAAVGVSGAKVDRFDLGCSSSFAAPTAIEQGVLQFKADGVTTVTADNDLVDMQNISNIASSQNFHPVGGWVFPDDGVAAITGSANFHPNAGEFNGALTITSGQYGGIDSHLPETPGTQACDKVMTSHHLPSVYESGDQFAGSTCSLVWMLVAAIQHGGVNQTALASGLQAAKTVQTSFPNGPNDFSAPGTTTGGEYWRPISYHASCQCWMVVNPAWSPSFR